MGPKDAGSDQVKDEKSQNQTEGGTEDSKEESNLGELEDVEVDVPSKLSAKDASEQVKDLQEDVIMAQQELAELSENLKHQVAVIHSAVARSRQEDAHSPTSKDSL